MINNFIEFVKAIGTRKFDEGAFGRMAKGYALH